MKDEELLSAPSPEGYSRLVGRDAEVQRLIATASAAATGRGGLVVLRGDAGMGKSSITDIVCSHAESEGMRVVSARCWEAVDAPAYWLWSHIARGLQASEVTKLLAGSGLTDQDDRISIFEAVVDLLRGAAREQPLVIVAEDLHAADESSLMMLRFLAHSGLSDDPILVIATYDPIDARRRSNQERELLAVARDAETIELGPLQSEHVAQMHAALTGERPSSEIAEALTRVSEGNPFFVEEAIRLLTTKGELQRPDFSTGFRVPQGARDILLRRLTILPDEVAETIAVASVIGRTFEVHLLAAVTGVDSETLMGILDRAVNADVLEEESAALGRFAFRHILLRELLYEELSAARRMRLHRAVAEAIETRFGQDPERLSELAHHWFKSGQAGDPQKTLDLIQQAARDAMERHAYEEAVRLYQRAVRVGESFAIERGQRRALKESLAEAERQSGSIGPRRRDESSKDSFAWEGDFWSVTFDGRVSRLKDGKGTRYLAQLLLNPGREIHAVDLVQLAGGRPAREGSREHVVGTDPFAGTGELLDQTAREAYKTRIEVLAADMEEAQSFNDPERVALLQAEFDAIVGELKSSTGLGGRDRTASSPSERARVNVTKSLKETLKRIERNDPKFASHLNATIRTGTYCSYQPDPASGRSWDVVGPR